MCITNSEKIIAIAGKSSEMISSVLVKALRECGCQENISVVWGDLQEIAETSGDVDISLLLSLDCEDIMGMQFPQNIKNMVVPYRGECAYKRIVPDACNLLQYAVEENFADIVAKNVVRTETYTSFELLAVGRIGRLRFDEKTDATAENMLAAAGVMLAVGIDFDSVIKSLNNKA